MDELGGQSLEGLMKLGLRPETDSESDAASPQADLPFEIDGFEIIRELGRGGMGIVYEARDLRHQRQVAVKVLPSSLLMSLTTLRRFRQEIAAVASLDHPHIVRVFDAQAQGSPPWFSMAYLGGGSLVTAKGDFENRRVADVMRKIADGIQYAHDRGLLHRDLKPSNILFDTQGEPFISDFGLAKSLDDDSALTLTGDVIGTPHFMAPEQAGFSAGERLTTAVDVYGLGAILYYLLTQRPPVQGSTTVEVVRRVAEDQPQSPSAVCPSVNRDLETICLKCLSKDPRERYDSARSVAEELTRWLEGRPIQARPASIGERLTKWARRKPSLAGLAGVTILSVLLGGAGVFVQWREAKRSAVREREERERAEQASEALWRAASMSARGSRLSGEIGARERSLAAIASASRHRTSLELRNEAIAALAQTDLRLLGDRHLPSHTKVFSVNANAATVSFVDGQGGLHVSDLGEATASRSVVPGLGSVRWMRSIGSGDYVLVQYRTGKGQVLDVSTGQTVFDLPAFSNRLVHESSLGVLGVLDAEGTLYRFDTASGDVWAPLSMGSDVNLFCLSPDGERIATLTSRSLQIKALQGAGAEQRLALELGFSLAWNPRGNEVAIGRTNGDVQLWNFDENSIRILSGHEDKVFQVSYSAARPILATSAYDGTMRLWDTKSGEPLLLTNRGYGGRFSHDGQRLSFFGANGRVGCYELISGRAYRPLAPEGLAPRGIRCADFSPDGRWVAAAHVDGWCVFDTESGREVMSRRRTGTRAVFFLPDGDRLSVVGNWGISMVDWRGAELEPGILEDEAWSPEEIIRLPSVEFVQAASLGWSGRFLAILGGRTNRERDRVCVVDLEEENEVHEFKPTRGLIGVALSPDDRWVAASSFNGVGGRIWETTTGKEIAKLPAINSEYCFDPLGRWLVNATHLETEFRNLDDWGVVRRLERDSASDLPGLAAISSDGRWLARTRNLRQVELLDMKTGETLGWLTPPDQRVVSWLSFSRDGRYLAVGTKRHLLQVWDLQALRGSLAELGLDW